MGYRVRGNGARNLLSRIRTARISPLRVLPILAEELHAPTVDYAIATDLISGTAKKHAFDVDPTQGMSCISQSLHSRLIACSALRAARWGWSFRYRGRMPGLCARVKVGLSFMVALARVHRMAMAAS
jgi:hypothetical protein